MTDEPTPEEPAPDDPVDGSVRVFRRITEFHLAKIGQPGERLSRQAFEVSSDNSGISVSLEDAMLARQMTPRDLMQMDDAALGIVYLTAEQIRAIEPGKDVERDATPEDPSHGLIVGPDSKGIRKQMYELADTQWEIDERPWLRKPESAAGDATEPSEQQG